MTYQDLEAQVLMGKLLNEGGYALVEFKTYEADTRTIEPMGATSFMLWYQQMSHLMEEIHFSYQSDRPWSSSL